MYKLECHEFMTLSIEGLNVDVARVDVTDSMVQKVNSPLRDGSCMKKTSPSNKVVSCAGVVSDVHDALSNVSGTFLLVFHVENI